MTSPIDDILATGSTTQLDATARNSQGDPVSASFTWTTSDGSVIEVGSSGAVTAVGSGTARVTASASGGSGSIDLRVVDANLTAVAALAGDAFGDSLVASLTGEKQTPVRSAWDACAASAAAGNVQAVDDCVADIRTESTSATDGSDRASLAVLVLFADQIERHLGL